MAIKINSTDVITNSPDIVNVRNGNYTGIVTATKFVGVNNVPIENRSIGLILTFGR